VEVPPKHVPYFKPGKELKDLINAGEAEAAPSGTMTLAEPGEPAAQG
jgi:integration host factor subunit beta